MKNQKKQEELDRMKYDIENQHNKNSKLMQENQMVKSDLNVAYGQIDKLK